MKKFTTFLSVTLITLLLVSCGGGGKDYRNMIPSDATMVMSFKPKTIAHKAQIGDFTQNDLYKVLEAKLIENEELTPEAREYILSLVAEPSKSGLSMDHDAFMFLTGQNIYAAKFGILFKVKNRRETDKFAEFIAEKSDMEKSESDGIVIIKSENTYEALIIAYNNDAFLICISEKSDVQSVKNLFAQKKEESIMNRPQISSVLDGNNDMNAVISYSLAMPMIQQFGMGQLLGWMGQMRVVMTGNFEKGECVSEVKILFDSEEAEKQYMEFAGSSLKATGELAKYLPEGSIAAFGGGIKGEKLYNLLTQIPMYGIAMSMYPQVQTIMNSLEGDIIWSFNTIADDGGYPLATVVAKTKDQNIIAAVRELVATTGMKLNETAPGHFTANLNGVQVWMGCKDDLFYITSDNAALELISNNGEGASMNDRFGNLFTDSYATAVVDFVPLNTLVRMYFTDNHGFFPLELIMPLLESADNMQLWTPSLTEFKSVAVMADQDKNAAETMFDAIETMIKMVVELKENHHHGAGCCH